MISKKSQMFKELGARGQISLGKSLPDDCLSLSFYEDEQFELFHMKVVPQGGLSAVLLERASATGGWLLCGESAQCSRLVLDNREALTAFAQQVDDEGTAAVQLEKCLARRSFVEQAR